MVSLGDFVMTSPEGDYTSWQSWLCLSFTILVFVLLFFFMQARLSGRICFDFNFSFSFTYVFDKFVA